MAIFAIRAKAIGTRFLLVKAGQKFFLMTYGALLSFMVQWFHSYESPGFYNLGVRSVSVAPYTATLTLPLYHKTVLQATLSPLLRHKN